MSSPIFQAQDEPLEAIDRLPDPEPARTRQYRRLGRLAVVYLAIAANCLTAGGVVAFALFSPYIQHRFRLDQAGINAVGIGGVLGCYLSAGPIGLFADSFGPRWTSILGAALNGAGYLAFGGLLASDRHASPGGLPIQYALAAAYVLIGSGAVASYFCSLKTSTLTFPTHPSVALSVPLAFFGLSGAFLSALAGLSTFDDGERPGELDARKLARFLTVLVTASNILGAAGLKIMPSAEGRAILAAEEGLAAVAAAGGSVSIEVTRTADEETALLPAPVIEDEAKEIGQGVGSLVDLPFGSLVKERSFWVLGAVLFFVVGPAEMIISSLGSLILALLPPPSAPQSTLALLAHALLTQPAHASPFHNMNMPSSSVPSAKAVQARQVLFFSVANTLARLIGGAAADFLSAPLNTVVILPPSSNSRRGRRWFSGRLRRPRISKITFFLAVLLPLGMVYLWAAVGGLTHASSLPILTVVVGLSYGLIFTLAPALIAQVFGLQTFGRNFGLQSYFMAASSLGFTFLYGLMAERYRLATSSAGEVRTDDDDDAGKVCRGPGCFQGVLFCAVAATIAGAIGTTWLRQQWRART